MRLKFIFFPLVLGISLAMFISKIWPAIDNLKVLQKEIADEKKELELIEAKKNAIESIGSSLSGASETKFLVESYLPEKKVEEQIINRLNFLTTDAGVSLVDMSILSSENLGNPAQNASVRDNLTDISSREEVNGGEMPVSKEALKYVEANVKISGDYAKMKIFFDQVQKMPIFNSTKSLRIYTEKNSDSNERVLMADMFVNFGYIEKMKTKNQKISQLNVELDTETISALKAYLSQKTSEMTQDSSGIGKTNPFAL